MPEKKLIFSLDKKSSLEDLIIQKKTHDHAVANLYFDYQAQINDQENSNPEEIKKITQNYKRQLLIAENTQALLHQEISQAQAKINHSDEDNLIPNEDLQKELLVQSVIFFPERQQAFQDYYPQRDEAKQFVTHGKKYLETLMKTKKIENQYQKNYFDLSQYRDLILNIDDERKIAHNNLITLINRLNILCQQANIMPFTYRNFLPHSRDNLEHAFNQVSNDRRRVALYAQQLINSLTAKYQHFQLDT